MVTKTDISYELELLENVSAADIENGHEDTINIWISGSGSSNTSSGYYRYLMQYKDKKSL